MAALNNYQPAKDIASNDKTLSGAGFVVRMFEVSGGIVVSERPFRFCVAGAATLPDISDMWYSFRDKCRAQLIPVEPQTFINLVLRTGYVQIDETTMSVLSY